MAKTKKQEEKKEARRESQTGTTPTPEQLGEGVKLYWPRKGQVHRAVIVKEGDEFLVRVGKQTFSSLSSAASSISGHAERGGTTWRREGEDRPLLGRPRYAEAGVTPAPTRKPTTKAAAKKARTPRAKKGDGTNGTIKTRKGVQCGICNEWFANAGDASKHVAEEHPAKK